ncbi:unnamed protein product [Linum trigynum]|uniref:Uncharacterized protein n=1 Tax=Linum trigynum TaxID=586398 RepID=A0AAV2FQ02_9ROSI
MMPGVACHPQWRQLLSLDELIYHELCLEFYSTFSHVVPTSKKSRPYVEFMLGGQPWVLTYDAFAQAMGLNTTYMMMMERHYTVDFHYQGAFQALYRPSMIRRSTMLAAPMRLSCGSHGGSCILS